jgi:cellulose synthase/poly-beta-1,6-N-acetylglucosamine synthase-like glycosyltransferase
MLTGDGIVSILVWLAAGLGTLHILIIAVGVRLITRRSEVEPAESYRPFVSVLVAARNEEALIPYCVKSLCAQDYPTDRIEIIIVDDQSTDDTPRILEELAAKDERIRCIVPDPQSDLSGKSAALHTAIQQARGSLLLITDADCTPPNSWVKNMVCQMADPDLGLVCGVTAVSHTDLFSGIQALDWILLLATAAAASEAGFPITGMGNNMCLRKEAYDSVGGYPEIPESVTEDYALFRRINDTPDWTSALRINPYLVNFTAPVKDLRSIWEQRRRWATGGFHSHPMVRALLVFIFLAQLLPIVGLFLFPVLSGVLILTKVLGDAFLTRAAQKKLRIRVPFRYFPVFELMLISYLILLPFAIFFTRSISWKGRTYRHSKHTSQYSTQD